MQQRSSRFLKNMLSPIKQLLRKECTVDGGLSHDTTLCSGSFSVKLHPGGMVHFSAIDCGILFGWKDIKKVRLSSILKKDAIVPVRKP